MFQICIFPNNTDANLALSFKTKDKAIEVWGKIKEAWNDTKSITAEFGDDFGYIVSIRRIDIAYTLFVDIEQSQYCQHEKNLAMARAGRKIQQDVSNDADAMAALGIFEEPKPRPKIIQ